LYFVAIFHHPPDSSGSVLKFGMNPKKIEERIYFGEET
jgi:hypothetical protein